MGCGLRRDPQCSTVSPRCARLGSVAEPFGHFAHRFFLRVSLLPVFLIDGDLVMRRGAALLYQTQVRHFACEAKLTDLALDFVQRAVEQISEWNGLARA